MTNRPEPPMIRVPTGFGVMIEPAIMLPETARLPFLMPLATEPEEGHVRLAWWFSF